jgi:WD40 repeat protein
MSDNFGFWRNSRILKRFPRFEINGINHAVNSLMGRIMRQFTSVCLLLFASVFLGSYLLPAAERKTASTAEAIPVICPAIEQDERPRTDNEVEAGMPVSLVAKGIVQEIPQTNGYGHLFELTVERVIYGSWTNPSVRFSYPWNIQKYEPAIVALVSSEEEMVPFTLKYVLPGSDEKSQVALAAARLDYQVLSAECIFVGRESTTDARFLRTVEVVRSIFGPGPKPGSRVTVQFPGMTWNSLTPIKVPVADTIYLIGSIKPGKKVIPHLPSKMANEMIYTLVNRLDATQEKQVQAALKHRDSYPIVEMNDSGKKLRCREVMFQGSTSEAIELLGSTSDAAVTLGVRKLKNTEGALAAIVPATEKDLFQFADTQEHGFRRLHNLILLLGSMDQGTSEGAIGKLLEKLLAQIESKPPDLPASLQPAHYSHYWSNEEENEDVNHGLVWLLMAMKEDEVLRHYAQRMVRLRDRLSGNWRDEVQLALDAARVEDNLELDTAKAAAKDIQPLRISPAIRASGEPVAFSHDSRFLAAGNAVWDVHDWSKVGSFKQDGTIEQVLFSKDDKFLYVIGGAGIEIHNRFDWRTGKLDKAFEGHKEGLFYTALTPDDRQMLTASYYEGVIHLWDVPTGKIVKSFELPQDCHALALSPDGKTLARQTSEHEITVQPLAGGRETRLSRPDNDEICEVIFSPNINYLLVTTYGFASEASSQRVVHLFVYDATKSFKLLTNATLTANRCTAMAVSTDSKWLVLGDQDGRAWAVSLPDLKTVKMLISTKEVSLSSGRISFSPDGNLLTIGTHDDAIHIFNASTFEPIQIPSGHTRSVTSVYFSNDGNTIRSLGGDNMVCSWDPTTGKMKTRFALPKDTTCVSVRPPDGRYALCASAIDVETPFWNPEKKVLPVKVVDLDTGKVVSGVDLPVNWPATATRVLWLKEPEALCLTDRMARRFNYLTGEMLGKHGNESSNQNASYNDADEVAEDGQTLYSIDGGYKIGRVSLERFNIDTGESTKVGEADLPHVTGNGRGLVPGGKYFFISDPGMYIYDRNNVKIVAQKKMKDWDFLHTTFSPQGNYYAIAAGARRIVGDNFTIYEPDVQTIIRVQETLTGKTVFVFPAHSRWVRDIKFSPDAKRLAVVTDDGFIEIWDLKLTEHL